MNILHSKLKSPRRQHTLHRKRLSRLFDGIGRKKLVAVTAGAGFGKTTFVMDALERARVVSAWYRLDEQDMDFVVFVSYLYAMVQQNVAGSEKIDTTAIFARAGLKKQTDVLLEWLAFLESAATQNIVLVLDDYHLVQAGGPINAALDFILERLPEKVHLVIIGRKNLSIRLATLRARQQLVEISERDLAFTADEIRRFFGETFRLTPAHLNDIHNGTGGWAASLVLLRYAFEKNSGKALNNHLKQFHRNPEHVFSYLKDNFFDCQPIRIQSFLMKISLFEEIDTHRLSAIPGLENAGEILNRMVEDHLMIFPTDETGTFFYLHHLFRDFLRTQLVIRFPAAQIRELHLRIARQIKKDDIFAALNHFIEARAFDDAIQMIEEHEIRFLLEGKVNFLDRCLKKIPQSIIAENPQLLLLRASLASYFGAPGEATGYLIRAHRLFKRQKSNEKMVYCLVQLGTQYYYSGYLKEAKLLMEQVLDEVEKQSPTYIIAMTFLIFFTSVLGEFETSDGYFEAVWDVIRQLKGFERDLAGALINTSYSHTLYFKGDFERSQQVSRNLLKTVLELDIEQCLPLAYYQLSANCFFLQAFEEGYEYGRKGIEICEKIKLLDTRKAWIYIAWAQNCLGLGKPDRAMELIQYGIDMFETPGNRWGLANALNTQHLIYVAQGRRMQARKILDRAFDIIDGYGLSLTEGTMGNSYAGLLMAESACSESIDFLEKYRSKLKGAGFHLFDNHLLSAKCYWAAGRKETALTHLSEAILLSGKYSYERFMRKESWALDLLKEEMRRNVRLDTESISYLKAVFQKELAAEPPILEIRLLGPFEIALEDRHLTASQWDSAKALMIFKYLAANRRQGFVPREVLIEMLWPEGDLRKTTGRFNMAMSALRKTLEPGLPPKSPSTYIERKKDMYRLYPDHRIIIDTDQFSDMLKQAQKEKKNISAKLDLYIKAVSIYRGEFLQEDPYAQWCLHEREHYSAQYLTVLRQIVKIYKSLQEEKKAAVFSLKILEADAFDETAFKDLIIFYAESGDLPMAQKTYQRYIETARQMDFPASPDIQNVYDRIIKKSIPL